MSVKLSKIVPEIREAFKAGNKARKKEVVQDTVESVPMDLKAAVYAWCANTKAAIKKLNAGRRLPYKIDDFYRPEAIWEDLKANGWFESEEYIHMTGRGEAGKGAVSIFVQVLPDRSGIEVSFWYETADNSRAEWLDFQKKPARLIIQDLQGDRGSRTVTRSLDRCWDCMFG
jgi:hypothetical protein